ncbi:MAG: hypothetical protein ACLPTF_13950, partial [Steroidobacteraceae bacterium]
IYITGRVKDMIIRRGQHIYPDEIENAIGELAGVRKGCVVAFGTKEPTTAVFANNVTNKHASLDNMIQLTLPSPEYNRVETNQPLTIGVDLSYRFR